MTTTYYDGAAGTGKTTALFTAVEAWLQAPGLRTGEAILALTYMHGSRRRLERKLRSLPFRPEFSCLVLDAFCWRLVTTWRSWVRNVLHEEMPGPTEYDRTCSIAARLLRYEEPLGAVAARYPLLILDEAQDLGVERLAVVQALAARCTLLAAGDEFQNLKGPGQSPAVAWLESLGTPNRLTEVRRTTAADLLASAARLRDGESLLPASTDGSFFNADGLTVTLAFKADHAARALARFIVWHQARDLVVLTPTGAASAKFVHEALRILTETQIVLKKGQSAVGPYPVTWHVREEELEQDALAELGCAAPEDATRVFRLAECTVGATGLRIGVDEWLRRERNLRGEVHCSGMELRGAVRALVRRHQSYGGGSQARGHRAMTIYHAKNQEFDHVAVLWPYQIVGDKARLLYNAITRARVRATVIVQGEAGDLAFRPIGPVAREKKTKKTVGARRARKPAKTKSEPELGPLLALIAAAGRDGPSKSHSPGGTLSPDPSGNEGEEGQHGG